MGRLLILLASLVISISAQATIAQKSMDCTSEKFRLHYKGTETVGGDYSLKSLEREAAGTDMEVVARTSDAGIYGKYESLGSDVIFTVVSSKPLSVQKSETDCYYEHNEWRSETVIKVDKTNSFAFEQLGVKAGDILKFTCDESTHFPSSARCR